MNTIKQLWDEKPLRLIIMAALVLRLISAVFSGGYAFHDDHFSIVASSQSWVDGDDYNNWMPWSIGDSEKIDGHSLFYSGIHFLLFGLLEFLGIGDPKTKMLLIRIFHALFSILAVTASYRITKLIGTKHQARMVGLLMAVLWFMPFLAVRNLIEIVCIVPLLYGSYYVELAAKRKESMKWYAIGGAIMGLAFSIRFQTAIIPASVGLALLIVHKWRAAFVFGGAALASMALVQAIPDMIIWGRPFEELRGYIADNVANRNAYLSGGAEKYILVLIGIFILPMSVLWLVGFFRTWRKHVVLFLPAFIFLAFHSVFPNKQERFIFPIVGYFMILGFVGWDTFRTKSSFWQKNNRLHTGLMTAFWVINIVFLAYTTPSSTKLARVAAMNYLADKPNNEFIYVDDSGRSKLTMMPSYYLDNWSFFYHHQKNDTPTDEKGFDQFSKYVRKIYTPEYFAHISTDSLPAYIILIEDENIEKRIEATKQYFPNMKYMKTVKPSRLDALLESINDANNNYAMRIFSVQM